MSPADVYLLLKSSDFVQHDLNPELVFDGCDPAPTPESSTAYELELVLRKWYPVDRARELRCFVRQENLIGTYAPHLRQLPERKSPASDRTAATRRLRHFPARPQLLRLLERA